MAMSPSRAADVDVTANEGPIDLDARSGSTMRVFPGITAGGDSFSTGVKATTQSWSVTNDGTISGFNGLRLEAGGTLDNSKDARVEGSASAVIIGKAPANAAATPTVATVDNYGAIAGGSAEGLTIYGGATVTNRKDASITATSSFNALSIGGFYNTAPTRTVLNEGQIINYGTTGFSAGIFVGGAPVTVTNTSTGEIKGGYNGIYTSNTAQLTLYNDGLVESTRGPGVEIDGGGGVVTNTGTIRSGQNGISFTGAGTIVNSGTIGSTGSGLAIRFGGSAAHTLRLDTGSILNGNVSGGTGTDRLELRGTGTESLAKFLNFETLSMQGAQWSLIGAGTFSVSSSVDLGQLNVDGTLTSPSVTVKAYGRLGGGGTIVGAVDNQGTINAGNSIGTLSVTGTLGFAAGSKLEVEVDAAGASDLVAVNGTVTIEGGTVSVLAAAGQYDPSTTYTILTSTGLSGAFTGVTSNFAFLTPSLRYEDNNVYLRLDKTGIDFDAIGGTPNQRATGIGVQALGSGNPVYDAVLVMDVPGARAAFDQLSGEMHASLAGLFIDDSRFVREAALGRLRPEAGGTLAASGLWAQAYGAAGRWEDDGNAAGFGWRSGGLFLGADADLGEGWRLGALTGYGHASFDIDDRNSSGSADTLHAGLYGGGTWGAFSARGGAAYAWHRIDTGRAVAIPGYVDEVSAKYDGHTAQIFGEIGYAFHAGTAIVEPTAGLAYVSTGTESFSESGGAAALSSSGFSRQATFSTLGVRASAPFDLGGMPARASGFVGWRHAFGGTLPSIDLAFPGGAPFAIAGAPIARDAAILDFGLEVDSGASSRLSVSYSGQVGGGTASHAFKAGFSLKF